MIGESDLQGVSAGRQGASRQLARLGVVGMLAVLAAGCARTEAPGIRQLTCKRGGMPDMVLELDIGRGRFEWVNAARDGSGRLLVSRRHYVLLFDRGRSMKAAIGRFDGQMILQRIVVGKGSPVQRWSCAATGPGQKL